MRKFFLFDCETGGKNPKTSLLTLYGMVLNEKLELLDTIDLKIKPNNRLYNLTAEALSVNKIDIVAHDSVAILESQAANDFYDFVYKHSIGDARMIPAGHNLSLDISFVKKHLLKADNAEGDDWGKFFSYRRLDTATIAHYLILAGKLPHELDCSLESLATHFGLSYAQAHDAKFDAELTLNVLKKLIGLVEGAPVY